MDETVPKVIPEPEPEFQLETETELIAFEEEVKVENVIVKEGKKPMVLHIPLDYKEPLEVTKYNKSIDPFCPQVSDTFSKEELVELMPPVIPKYQKPVTVELSKPKITDPASTKVETKYNKPIEMETAAQQAIKPKHKPVEPIVDQTKNKTQKVEQNTAKSSVPNKSKDDNKPTQMETAAQQAIKPKRKHEQPLEQITETSSTKPKNKDADTKKKPKKNKKEKEPKPMPDLIKSTQQNSNLTIEEILNESIQTNQLIPKQVLDDVIDQNRNLSEAVIAEIPMVKAAIEYNVNKHEEPKQQNELTADQLARIPTPFRYSFCYLFNSHIKIPLSLYFLSMWYVHSP